MSTRPSFFSAALIVANREIRVRFLSKAFIISTIITVLLMLLLVVLGPRIGDIISGGPVTVAAAPSEAAVLQGTPGIELTEVVDAEAARQAVLDESADAAVVADPTNSVGLRVLTLSGAPPRALFDALSVSPAVELLDLHAPHPAIHYLLSMGFALVWMMAALGFGMTIAQSVVEEKETRIVEILLATISSRALLTGKVLGNSLAALAQIVLIAGAVLLGLAVNDDVLPAGDLLVPVLWFIPLFVIGFVMIAAMFAASAALVSRNEDLQSIVQPMMWLIMLPYFGVLFGQGNTSFMAVLSYIPISSPIALPLRIFTGDVVWWEPLVSVALLVATTVVVILVGARVYDRGLLHTGKPMAWKEALARAS